MASDWQAFKRSWSNKEEPLTLCVALRAVHAFTSRSLGPRMAKVSWKRIGIEADQPLNRDMLFVNRASEIFSTVREKQQPQPQSAALSIFKEVSPKKAKCKGKGCGQLLSSTMKICFNCGLQNPDFDDKMHKVHQQGFRSGWKKSPQTDNVCDDKELTSAEKALLSQVDDLTKELLAVHDGWAPLQCENVCV